MAYYNDKEEREEFQRRMKRLGEQMKEGRTCAQLSPTMGTCGSVCTNVQSMSYQPSASFLKPDEMSVGEKMFKQLADENKKLTGEKSKLLLQILTLQNELRIVKEENYNYSKVKVNKNKIFKDFFLSVKEGSKLLYQDIIKWFNT